MENFCKIAIKIQQQPKCIKLKHAKEGCGCVEGGAAVRGSSVRRRWQWHHNRLTDKHTNALAIKHTHKHTYRHTYTLSLSNTQLMQKLLHCRSLSCALLRSLSLQLRRNSSTAQSSSFFVCVHKCRKKLDLDYFLCKPMSTRERVSERASAQKVQVECRCRGHCCSLARSCLRSRSRSCSPSPIR